MTPSSSHLAYGVCAREFYVAAKTPRAQSELPAKGNTYAEKLLSENPTHALKQGICREWRAVPDSGVIGWIEHRQEFTLDERAILRQFWRMLPGF